MDNIDVTVLANSYVHTFKSWGKTPKWAQDKALLVVASMNDDTGVICGVGTAMMEDDGVIGVLLYTSEYWRDHE